jgi:hypothetical protein
MMKKLLVTLPFWIAVGVPGVGQPAADRAMIAKIRAEGLERSQVARVFETRSPSTSAHGSPRRPRTGAPRSSYASGSPSTVCRTRGSNRGRSAAGGRSKS